MTSGDDGLDAQLSETAAELASVLAGWRLTAARRDRLYARAQEIVERRSRRPAWRRWRERWLPAALGGAVVAAAAGAAIGLAIARERRQQQATAAA
jgi:hypothetical protein